MTNVIDLATYKENKQAAGINYQAAQILFERRVKEAGGILAFIANEQAQRKKELQSPVRRFLSFLSNR